ncbi:MAG: type II toxin-antitoxin system VapC family toxin [Candidatus Solibacter usitatus]|nr:type II toxin-antitoxin system VapC family toxin [Candidatus Solibacter usitatus]
MTLDTSAVLAILQDEPERREFVTHIEQSARRLISTVSVLEAAMVLEHRRGDDAGSDLDLFLQRGAIECVPFDQEQLLIARTAFRRFGKGRHSANLNFGDCASYALAQWSGEPLLFKGADFAATDVARVMRVDR